MWGWKFYDHLPCLTLPYTGLAAANTLQRALSRAWIPALAMVTRPCSITSWMAVRSMSDILSNSSMHTTPRSASTMAPASRHLSPGIQRDGEKDRDKVVCLLWQLLKAHTVQNRFTAGMFKMSKTSHKGSLIVSIM